MSLPIPATGPPVGCSPGRSPGKEPPASPLDLTGTLAGMILKEIGVRGEGQSEDRAPDHASVRPSPG